MSNEQKKSRTLIADLPATEQEITAQEMRQVQGGARQGLREDLDGKPGTISPAVTTTTAPAAGNLAKAADPKKDKDKVK